MKTASTLLTVSLASTGLTLAASAQTFSLTMEGDGQFEVSAAVAPEGITLAHSSQGTGTQVTLNPHGDVISYYRHSGPDSDTRWTQVLATPDGSRILFGTFGDRALGTKVDLLSGADDWNNTGDTPLELNDACLSPDGNAVALGTVTVLGRELPYAWAVDPYGETYWRKAFGLESEDEQGRSIVALPTGDLVFASTIEGDVRITAVDHLGEVLWATRLDAEYGLSRPYLAVTPNGDLMLGALASGRYCAIGLSDTGHAVWAKRYATYEGDPFFGSTPLNAGAVAAIDGGYALAVTQPIQGGLPQDDPAILRIDASGNPLWFKGYGSTENETAYDIEITPDGGFVLTSGLMNPGRIQVQRTDRFGVLSDCPTADLSVTAESMAVTSLDAFVTTSSPFVHFLPAVLNPTVDSVQPSAKCLSPCEVVGGSIGQGLAGAGGLVPNLTAIDGACLGWMPELLVDNGVGGAVGFLAYGFSQAAIPVMGGTLYINPAPLLTIPVTLHGSVGVPGTGTLEYQVPTSIDMMPLIGNTITTQGFFLDILAPQGISITPGATLVVQ